MGISMLGGSIPCHLHHDGDIHDITGFCAFGDTLEITSALIKNGFFTVSGRDEIAYNKVREKGFSLQW